MSNMTPTSIEGIEGCKFWRGVGFSSVRGKADISLEAR